MTQPKRLKISTLLLTLCLGAAVPMPSAWAQASPATPAADQPAAADAPVNSGMGANLMYELMLAEISAYNGDESAAFQLMLDAAQKDRSEQLFERATAIALRSRAGDSALQAAQSWTRTLPSSREGNRLLVQILIGLNKLPETVDPIKRDLASLSPKDRVAAIAQVPRYFVRATDRKLAAKVVEQALTPELTNTTTGPAAYAAIGAMQLLAGDAEAAVAAAKKGATLNPKAEDPIQLALALMDPKLPDAEGLVLAHLQAGGRTELRMAYVRKLLEAQRFADANAQVVALNASQPDYPEAWLVRGSLAVQDKRTADAQSALTTYVDLQKKAAEPSNERGLSQAYFLLADVAEMNQKPAEAESWLAQITNPQDAIRVSARRASLLAHQGKLAEARALIRATPEATPEDARVKISAEVQLLRDNKQFVPVYDFLKEQVEKDPSDVDMRYDLAMAAEKLDKIDEMEKLLRQVIALKPDYHQAYNALGYSLADRKLRLPEARELVKKALEFAPNDPFILDSLGWVEFRSGNLNAALQILKNAYESRQDAEIAAHLGEVLWSLDLQDQAKAIWAKAQQQSPDNETLQDTIKRLSPL